MSISCRVSSIAFVQFAKNPPPWQIRQTSEYGPEYGISVSGYISGYLDSWISGYLDFGKSNLLLHLRSQVLCGAALPGAFFLEE